MPLVMMLLGGLLNIAGSMVGRVLLALGIGYVTYKGMDTGIGWLLTQIKSSMGAMPADVISFLAWLWVDKAISCIFSAYTAAALIRAAGAASITRMVTKSPSA